MQKYEPWTLEQRARSRRWQSDTVTSAPPLTCSIDVGQLIGAEAEGPGLVQVAVAVPYVRTELRHYVILQGSQVPSTRRIRVCLTERS
jgi:hypothetical protein